MNCHNFLGITREVKGHSLSYVSKYQIVLTSGMTSEFSLRSSLFRMNPVALGTIRPQEPRTREDGQTGFPYMNIDQICCFYL